MEKSVKQSSHRNQTIQAVDTQGAKTDTVTRTDILIYIHYYIHTHRRKDKEKTPGRLY